MKHTVYILLGLAVVAFGACGGNQFRDRLCHLDTLLVEHPDSVLQVLEGMHEEALTQAKGNRMYYELMRADAQNKAYVDFTTDSVMKIVADYYDRHGSANEQMRAHYLLGCTYRDLNDVPMELQCFQEAVEKADTTQKDCDWGRMASIYGQMADLYHFQYLPEEELKALSKCAHYSNRNHNNYASVKAYELSVRAYYFLNMPDSVLSITKNAHERYKALGLDQMAAMMLSPAIDILSNKEQYEEAERYIKEVDMFLGDKSMPSMNEREQIIFDYHKGNLALHGEKIDSALSCFKRVLATDKKEAAYKGLLSLYEKTGNSDSIAKYAKLYASANDSDRLNDNAQAIAQMTAMYNYGRQSYIAKLNEKKATETRQKLYLHIIVSAFVILFIVFCALRIKRAKENQIIEMTKSYFELLSQKQSLEREITSLASSNKALADNNKEIIEQKEKELLALQHLTDYYSGKLELDDFGKRLEAFKKTSIYSRLKQNILFKGDANNLTESEWKTYDNLFIQYFPRYYKCITSDHLLNHDEKRVCLLLILGFSPKELSLILNKTMQGISNIRASINKKIFNANSATTLNRNIRQLF